MQNIKDIDISEINQLKQDIKNITFNFERGVQELSEQNISNLEEVAIRFQQMLKLLPSAHLKVIISLDNVDDPVINKNYAIIRLKHIKKIFDTKNLIFGAVK